MAGIDFFVLCKARNWEKLKELQALNFAEIEKRRFDLLLNPNRPSNEHLALIVTTDAIFEPLGPIIKILTSAIFDTYHADEKIKNRYGLSALNNQLACYPLPEELQKINNRIDLFDFCRAYKVAVAKNEPNQFYKGLDDHSVAEKIVEYVRAHKVKLAGIFDHPNCSAESIALFKQIFGDISLNEKEKQEQLANDLLEEKEQQVQCLQEMAELWKSYPESFEEKRIRENLASPRFFAKSATHPAESDLIPLLKRSSSFSH